MNIKYLPGVGGSKKPPGRYCSYQPVDNFNIYLPTLKP